MRMSFCVFVVLSFLANAQFIETSFPAPCGNISGLAYNGSVWVLDSLDCMIYGVHDWTGALTDSIALPVMTNPPVGLAITSSMEIDTFWLAESGTALVHLVDSDGILLETYDFSDDGIKSISGLDINLFYSNQPLLILDSYDRSLYSVERPIGIQPIQYLFTIEDDIQVFDIGWENFGIPVACSDEISPIRFYCTGNTYEPLGYGTYESAVGVASTHDNRIYFNDPEMVMIHRYSPSMGGIEDETSAIIPFSFKIYPNPVVTDTEACLSLFLVTENCITIQLYDVRGRVIAERNPGMMNSGVNDVLLGRFTPGIYFCTVITENYTVSQRFVVVE